MSIEPADVAPEIDLADINDNRALAIGRVPANSRVLDLGLADGSVARSLKDMGCQIWGVGLDPAAGEKALDVCEEIIEADLNSSDLIELLGEQKFDVVLMLDVLEQLSNPTALLQVIPKVLAEDGWGVISLPNVAHASLRLDLLQGHFNYSKKGPSGHAQLRFFDRRGVDDLLEGAGWRAFDIARVIRRVNVSEFPALGENPELTRQLESDIEALTEQFVFSIAPQGSPVLTHPPVLPAAAAQNALFDAVNRIGELDEEVHQLKGQRIPDLADQLREIREKAIERKGTLKDILVAIRES